MTDTEFDRLLRAALMEAVWQDFLPAMEEAEHEQITYSARHLKRREKLLHDPFAYAKKMLQTPLQRAARMAAMILLVCSLLFAMALSVPEVRAALKRLYMEWYETYIAVYVQDSGQDEVADLSVYHVEIPEEVLPEGYRETVRNEYAGVIIYSDEAGKTISIDYRSTGKEHGVETNNDGMTAQKQVVDGIEYYQFESKESRSNQIIWINEAYDLTFRIIAPKELEAEKLLFLAQNILIEKK